MPRITTSDAKPEVIRNLARVAEKNHRTPAKEALVAIESHILNEAIKAPKARNPKRK